MNQHSIKRNTYWLLFQRIYSLVVSLVVSGLSARYLGASNLGLISYGASFITLFTSLSRIGTDEILVKKISSNKQNNKEGLLIGSTTVLRIFSGLVSQIIIYILTVIINPNNRLFMVLTMVQSVSLLFGIYEVFIYWFQAKLKMRVYSIITMIACTASALAKGLVLATDSNLIKYAAATCVQSLVLLVLTFYAYKKNSLSCLRFKFEECRRVARKSIPFLFASISIAIYTHTDRIMLGYFLGETCVGIYTVAASLSVMWEFIPLAIINTYRPMIYHSKEESEDVYENAVKRLLSVIELIGILVALVVFIAGKYVVPIIYGDEFSPAAVTLNYLIMATIISTCGTVRSIWFVSENKVKYSSIFSSIAALINILLNYFGIKIIGMNGVAVATLITEIVSIVILPLIFKETRQFSKFLLKGFTGIPRLIRGITERRLKIGNGK